MNATAGLLLIPTIVYFLFWICAMIYVLSQWRAHPAPSNLAFIGLSVGLFGFIATNLLRVVLPRYFNVQDMMMVYSLTNLGGTATNILAMILVMGAIYVGRATRSVENTIPHVVVKQPVRVSENPYDPN